LKKIVITQSNYIPWKGYFDGINIADEFVIYDDMQYTKRDWRNRNQIKTPQGLIWLSVPVEVSGKYFQKINETKISDKAWGKQHWNMLKQNYAKAPCFVETKDAFEELYLNNNFELLTELNQAFLERIMNFLEIKTKISRSEKFTLHEEKTQRLVNVCAECNATDYYSGAAAKAYMDESKFKDKNINVHYFDYSGYPEYPQLYGEFQHSVTILDLIFNTGTNATKYMKSFN
jgi:hypothetical protein